MVCTTTLAYFSCTVQQILKILSFLYISLKLLNRVALRVDRNSILQMNMGLRRCHISCTANKRFMLLFLQTFWSPLISLILLWIRINYRFLGRSSNFVYLCHFLTAKNIRQSLIFRVIRRHCIINNSIILVFKLVFNFFCLVTYLFFVWNDWCFRKSWCDVTTLSCQRCMFLPYWWLSCTLQLFVIYF